MIDDGTPICPQTDAPTFAPTVSLEGVDTMTPTTSPTKAPTEPLRRLDPWYASMFKTREHEDTEEEATEKAPATAPTDGKRRRLSVVEEEAVGASASGFGKGSATENTTSHGRRLSSVSNEDGGYGQTDARCHHHLDPRPRLTTKPTTQFSVVSYVARFPSNVWIV